MRRRKRFNNSEINLTPLLDVLFSILFIIMLSSAANEASTRADAREKIKDMKAEVAGIREQYDTASTELADASAKNEEYRDAMIISLQNTIEDSVHVLKVYINESDEVYDTIQLGLDLTEYSTNRISAVMKELVDSVDNMPVFVVFTCNKSKIYTIEFNAVNKILVELQDNNKEIFYKRNMVN